MPATVRQVDIARRQVQETRRVVGDELRQARVNAGLSQRAVAAALGCSPATISRRERGRVASLELRDVSAHAAVLGLVVRVNLFPAGSPLRDAGQLRLLNRLREHVAAAWTWQIEVPVAPDDLRAFDALTAKPGCRIAYEALSRVGDLQAQARAATTKQATAGADRLVLVLTDSHHNRRAVRLAGEALRSAFPLDTRIVLGALREGRDPGANGIVLL